MIPGLYDYSQYQGVKEICTVPYDPTPPVKTKTTSEAITASCTVEYDPTPPARTWTTHDEITARHTVEARRPNVGDTQIYDGEEYCWDGSKWIVLKDEQ